MMTKKPKKPRPVKPPRQEFRPWSGSSVRITIETGAPTPRFLEQMIVKKGEAR
jgi:hypothetical protein